MHNRQPTTNAFFRGFVKAAILNGLSEQQAVGWYKQAGYSLTNADLSVSLKNFNPKKPDIKKPQINRQSFKTKYPDVNKDINIGEKVPVTNPTVNHPVVKKPEVKDPPELKPPAEIKIPTVKAPKPITAPQVPLEAKPIDLSQSALLNRNSEGTQLSR